MAVVKMKANADAKISFKGLRANFQDVIDDAKRRLQHREFQLKESHDFAGKSHKPWVEAVAANIMQHLEEAERYLQEREP